VPGAGAPRGHRKRLRWISVGVVSGKPELELRKCGEPPVGIEPTTYALRGPSTPPPPPATCDFSAARTALGPSVYFIGRQFASQAVSRGRVRRGGRHAQGSTGHSRRDLTPTAGGQQLRRLHVRLFTVNRHDRHRCLTRCRMCSVTGTSSGLFTDGSSGTGTASGTSQTHSARGHRGRAGGRSARGIPCRLHVGVASNRSRLGAGRPVWRIASRRSPASAYISSGAARLCAPNHSSPLGPFSTRRQ